MSWILAMLLSAHTDFLTVDTAGRVLLRCRSLVYAVEVHADGFER